MPVHNLGLPGTQCPANRGSRVGLRTRCQANCMNFSKFTRAIQFPQKKSRQTMFRGRRISLLATYTSVIPEKPTNRYFRHTTRPRLPARAVLQPLTVCWPHQLHGNFNSTRFLAFPPKKSNKRCMEALETRSLPGIPRPPSSLASRGVCCRESMV